MDKSDKLIVFNQKSRTENVVRTSFAGVLCNVLNLLAGFLYRNVLIKNMSGSYLGVNGLLTNIFNVMSLAELGITTSVTYRFYEPIKNNDVEKVGQLMRFFERVYYIIAFIIFVLGSSLLPFINFFIKDSSEIPQDVNIRIVYILFMIQTIASYTYSYKFTLLSADQKQYAVSIIMTVINLVKNVVQIIVILIWKDYTISILVGIIITIILNVIISSKVTDKYKPIFEVKSNLSKEEKMKIYDDTKANLFHKIGATVLYGTDNIVISSFVGLVQTGIYSNYTLIIVSLEGLLNQALGSFTSSIGNARVSLERKQSFVIFKRLLFGNLVISGMCTLCLYFLIDDFIELWVGDKYLLDRVTTNLLCLHFFLDTMRSVVISYTNACGLFVKDRIRPIIQAVINLVCSIILVRKIGIIGVVLGTIISSVFTVFWREPYILYNYEFKESVLDYWKTVVKFVFVLFIIGGVLFGLDKIIVISNGIVNFCFKGLFIVAFYAIFLLVVYGKSEELKYYKGILLNKIARKKIC